MTTTTLSKYQEHRLLFLDNFNKGIKPVDGRQPIPDEVAKAMVQELIDLNTPKDATIGVVDCFMIFCTHLKEHGFTNLVLLEKEYFDKSDWNGGNHQYYKNVQNVCNNSNIKYYPPPRNNYNRCDMKFDVIIGNPPYGNAGNTAIKFLNACGDLSNDIRLVLPISVHKASSQNKIRLDLICVEDVDLPHDTFPGSIRSVMQRWVKTDSLRSKIKTFTTHPDFKFVTANVADLMVGRSGGGPCGRVKISDFKHYANDHFFIKVNSEEIKDRIVDLEDEFRDISMSCNGRPHLSKHELIETYIKHYG